MHYLPHAAVTREVTETTKVRIIYDGSCKDRKMGTSLHDCLHAGPPLTPLIFDILSRFTESKIALVGDIEKTSLNIEIDPVTVYLAFMIQRVYPISLKLGLVSVN